MPKWHYFNSSGRACEQRLDLRTAAVFPLQGSDGTINQIDFASIPGQLISAGFFVLVGVAIAIATATAQLDSPYKNPLLKLNCNCRGN